MLGCETHGHRRNGNGQKRRILKGDRYPEYIQRYPPADAARVGLTALHYGALLLDGVDEHDSTTAEIAQLVERRDRGADRRIGIRRLRN